ncbi:hypothetical protein W97_06432 [Coniosporium apollinis CBS 100218]|uniref:Probable 26S proteasome regulatory subunit p27 n=1 Tax=Coniosporium apollinis (strain CBS 100218) TaxID=1168221 RepID=R7YZH3_CONA1|nr:uncharacterized protein W97_06432 [Coniosporium apollinis CBS 100218]EON67179.1 hypothetical protein W97_06432 [Coniosporium apollinis CBS 100218]
MGLRMEDLHTPTVAAGPTSGRSSNGAAKDGLPLTELIAEKERVESELLALGSHGVNMNTSLTTFDGYPRDDIDVAQIRTTRARIIHLKNDYKDLMNRIEAGLHAHHASAAAANTSRPERQATTAGSNTSGREALEAPFAKVNSVVPDSPADTAGLKAGDSVLRFGTATWMNHEKLSKVAEVVSQNEGRPISVKVSRRDPSSGSTQELQMFLTPRRNWGGRGLLGCHLLPL